MNSGWKRYKLTPTLIQTLFPCKRAAVSRHADIEPGLDFSTVSRHCLLPFLRSVDALGRLKLRRGLVEGALFGFGGASLHALSVA